jgi:hypothetical protein
VEVQGPSRLCCPAQASCAGQHNPTTSSPPRPFGGPSRRIGWPAITPGLSSSCRRGPERRRRPRQDRATCLCARLGPRLVHTPSEPSGSQWSPVVSSGASVAQVAGLFLGEQAAGQNPDKWLMACGHPGRMKMGSTTRPLGR